MISKKELADLDLKPETFQKCKKFIDKNDEKELEEFVKNLNDEKEKGLLFSVLNLDLENLSFEEKLAAIQIGDEVELKNVELDFEAAEVKFEPRVSVSQLFSLYEFSFGEGNSVKFLITEPFENVQDLSKIVLRPLEKEGFEKYLDRDIRIPKRKAAQKMAKEFGISLKVRTDKEKRKKNSAELWGEIKEKIRERIKNDGTPRVFVKENKVLNPKKTHKLKPSEVFNEYLFGNVKKISKKFKWIFNPKFINLGNSCVPKYQKYNDHTLTITNSATGKTETASRVAEKIDEASSAGISGFSTADKTAEGQVNGRKTPLLFDDVTGLKFEKNFLNGLPNLLRDGIHTTSKGQKKVETKVMAPFIFTINPKTNDSANLVLEFSDLLSKFTEIPQQTASRIPVFLFNSQCPNVETQTKYSENQMEKLAAISEYFGKELSKITSNLLGKDRIQKWLETPDEDYKQLLNELGSSVSISDVADFVKNQAHSFRGIKGAALKLAIIEIADEIGFENREKIGDNVEEIIKKANNFYETLKQINVTSFENLIKAGTDITKHYKKKLESEKRLYIKILVKALAHRFLKDPESTSIILEELEDEISRFGEKKYKHLSAIKQVLPKKDQARKLSQYLSPFGIDCIKHNRILKFKIVDKDQVQTYGKIVVDEKEDGKKEKEGEWRDERI